MELITEPVISFLYGLNEICLVPKTDFKVELSRLLHDCLFEATPSDDQALFGSIVLHDTLQLPEHRHVNALIT